MSETSPILDRLESRSAGRAAYMERGWVGLPAAGERREEPDWGAVALARGDRRTKLAEGRLGEIRGIDDHFRAFRYASGPWDGDPKSMLPVSWFLLWRSNVKDEIQPAEKIRESYPRGPGEGRSTLEARERPSRSDPHLFTTRAEARPRPRDLSSLRARPITEE